MLSRRRILVVVAEQAPSGRLADGTQFYGRLGEIAYDSVEDKVQCHLCGFWFRQIAGSHLTRKHDWTIDEYRVAFRLPVHVATCSPSYSQECRQRTTARVAPGGDFAHTAGRFRRDPGAAREAGARSVSRRVVAGIQVPFLKRRPELAAEWHPTRNAAVSAAVLGMYSPEVVWWRCVTCGHEWQATVKSRAHGTGCPRCYREHNQRALREANARRQQAAVARRPLASTHPQLAAELHRTRNPGLDAGSVSAGSGLRVWWRCATCGHEWQATITNRTNRVRPSGCPACAGKATPRQRSLAARHPDLYAEWHGTRNGQLDPFALSPGSGRSAWWRCRPCGHEWQARIESRTKHGTGCPACYAASWTPPVSASRELLPEWHPTRNHDLDPQTIRQASDQRVWWRCPTCGHEWQASPASRRRRPHRGCPRCAVPRRTSSP
jgi:protein-arginine kinase activator protein McsA